MHHSSVLTPHAVCALMHIYEQAGQPCAHLYICSLRNQQNRDILEAVGDSVMEGSRAGGVRSVQPCPAVDE